MRDSMANRKAVSDEEIAAALLTSRTIKDAAQAVGLSAREIYNRLETKETYKVYRQARADVLRTAVNNVNDKLSLAIEEIADIMTDKATNPAIRLQCAQTLLANAGRLSGWLHNDEAETRKIGQTLEQQLLNDGWE